MRTALPCPKMQCCLIEKKCEVAKTEPEGRPAERLSPRRKENCALKFLQSETYNVFRQHCISFLLNLVSLESGAGVPRNCTT